MAIIRVTDTDGRDYLFNTVKAFYEAAGYYHVGWSLVYLRRMLHRGGGNCVTPTGIHIKEGTMYRLKQRRARYEE